MTPNRMLLNVYSISLKKRKENMQKKKKPTKTFNL